MPSWAVVFNRWVCIDEAYPCFHDEKEIMSSWPSKHLAGHEEHQRCAYMSQT